ncbi:hypothetical protein ACHAQA_005830 [Verticillium albo-atrum]
MRRVTRIRAPRLLATATSSTPALTSRCLSTTTPSSSDTTDRFRKLLWKGKAPGPADPYAQTADSSAQQPDLEAYEAELAELQSQTQDLGSLFPDAQSSSRPRRPASRLKTSYKPTRAPEVNEVGINGYTPAVSAEGLEEVGGFEGWWEREGHWGPESEYTSFAALEPVADAAVLEVLTRQAVVEALAFRKEREEGRLAADWAGTDRAALDRALALRIKVTDEGVVAVRGNTNAVVKGLAPSKRQLKLARREAKAQEEASPAVEIEAAEADEAAEATVLGQHVSPEEAQALIQAWDAEWKDISLADPLLKFAIGKRVFQLTGHLIADPKLARAETVRHVLNLLVRPPPAKKLVEALQRRGELFSLPNVSVHARRITPIDREREVGRWKLIEKELAKRALPVTGHAGLEKHREASWVKGGL